MRRFGIPLVFGLGLLLAACGGGNPSDPTQPSNPVQPSDPTDADSTKETPTIIGIGESKSGVIAGEARDFDYFKFTASAGEKLRLVAVAPEGSTLDPYMRLYKVDDYAWLEKADDTLASENAEILFNSDVAGEYLVEITSFKLVNAPEASDDLPTNTYTLSLSRR